MHSMARTQTVAVQTALICHLTANIHAVWKPELFPSETEIPGRPVSTCAVVRRNWKSISSSKVWLR